MLTLTTRDRENTRACREPKTSSTDLQGDTVNNLAMHVTFDHASSRLIKAREMWSIYEGGMEKTDDTSEEEVTGMLNLNLKSIPNDKSLGKLRSE